MGDSEGPEVDGLRVALEKAREFVKGVFLDKQIKDGEQFGEASNPSQCRLDRPGDWRD